MKSEFRTARKSPEGSGTETKGENCAIGDCTIALRRRKRSSDKNLHTNPALLRRLKFRNLPPRAPRGEPLKPPLRSRQRRRLIAPQRREPMASQSGTDG